MTLLEVADLTVEYGGARAVEDLSFRVARGEAFGLVGESGSGKTTVAMSIVRYLPRGGRMTRGRVVVDGQDIPRLNDAELRDFRGRRVAMVYQNPGSSLDPSMVVGEQVAEIFATRHSVPRGVARERTLALFEQVRLPDPEAVFRRYPHQLSGGMQQRIVIASALAVEPDLLILDEPTTGLDVTVEAAILRLIGDLRQALGLTVLFISHNLRVIADVCDRVGVLYAGRLVEQGPVTDIFTQPAHPYTRGLLASLPGPAAHKGRFPLMAIPGQPASAATDLAGCRFAPRCEFSRPCCTDAEPELLQVSDGRASRCYFWNEVVNAPQASVPESEVYDSVPPAADIVLSATNVRKTYSTRVVAVDGVTIQVPEGRTVGLVGESGSGKTTFARLIAGLEPLDSGNLAWRGARLEKSVERRPPAVLRELQMVFQDPDSTLNPRHSIRTLLDRSIRRLTNLGTSERQARAAELLDAVDLDRRYLDARPDQLSGGQRQRVAIARAFAGNPKLVLCDEPTSALDASVQATILNLLDRLQREAGTAYVFISHDLDVVRYLADVVGVLYMGQLMQLDEVEAVFAGPHHPYTEVLMASMPGRDPNRVESDVAGSAPRPSHGCPFQLHCPRKLGAICETEAPPWRQTPDGGGILCHIPLAELNAAQAEAG